MTLARWETTTAIKALLWCSVLSKARLVRFLSKKKETVEVATLCYNYYYVRLTDGTEDWWLPSTLSDSIVTKKRSGQQRVTLVALSGLGVTWAARFADNSWLWDSENSVMEKMRENISNVKIGYVAFGNNDDYVCRLCD